VTIGGAGAVWLQGELSLVMGSSVAWCTQLLQHGCHAPLVALLLVTVEAALQDDGASAALLDAFDGNAEVVLFALREAVMRMAASALWGCAPRNAGGCCCGQTSLKLVMGTLAWLSRAARSSGSRYFTINKLRVFQDCVR
jgi:hypothetical protein